MKWSIILLGFSIFLSGSLTFAEEHAITPYGQVFTLSHIIELALERNPIVAQGQGLVAEKEGRRRSSLAYPNPTFDFQGGRGSIRDPSIGTSVTERYFTLSQLLEWPGTRAADQRAADTDIARAQAMLQESHLNLRADVKHAFYQLLLSQKQVTLHSENLATVEQLERAVTARVDAGESPAFEALKLNVEKMKIQREVTQAEGAVRVTQASLNSLTSGALGANFSVQGDFTSLPSNPSGAQPSEKAITRHPTILKFQKSIDASRERLTQEEQARIPTVTLSGSYQCDAGREGFDGGLSLPLPLWDQRQGEIAQALGTLRQREPTLRKAKNSLLKNLEQQTQRVKSAADQIATYEEGLLKQAREAVRIAQVSFRFGEANLLDVLDTQRVLRETLLDYAQAGFDLSVAMTEFERLSGQSL